MKQRLMMLLLVVLVATPAIANAQRANDTMKRIFSEMDEDFKDYKWLGYPISNYGILSVSRSSKKRIDDSNKICSTFRCLGMPTPSDLALRLKVDSDLVEIGYGSPLSFTSESDRTFFLNAAFSSIQKLLGINFTLDQRRNIKVNLTTARIYKRSLNKLDFMQRLLSYRNSEDFAKQSLFKMHVNERMCVIIADVVVDEMALEVIVDSSRKIDIGAKLDEKLGTILGSDSTANLKITKDNDSTYRLSVLEPMIIAVYPQNSKDIRIF